MSTAVPATRLLGRRSECAAFSAAETRGNPLALLELPRGRAPAERAGGFGL